jgi:hypothetical protein
VSPHLWIPLAFGSLLVVLAAVGVPALPLALLGAGLIVVSGLVLYSRRARPSDATEKPSALSELAGHRELERLYRVLCEALAAVASQPEGARKEAMTQKLIALGVQFRAIASGAGALSGAESWYVAHDAILAVPDLKEYRAIVRIPNAECVRDPAIQESLRASFAAVRRGVLVERILILAESLWPMGRLLPSDEILPWIEDQHNHGHRVILIRERDLAPETNLPIDTCMFDDWAVGTRDLDDHSRTGRVALDFTPTAVRTALGHLDRLSNLGISFRELLVRAEAGG